VGVDMEVVPYFLVAHVVDSKQIPCILSDLNIWLVDIWGLPFLEKFYLKKKYSFKV
jgi:hypothetical protein